MSELGTFVTRLENAELVEVTQSVVSGDVVTKLAAVLRTIRGFATGEDQPSRRLRSDIWKLQQTVMNTLLRYDDQRLGIKGIAESIILSTSIPESHRGLTDRLAELVRQLLSTIPNPKMEELVALTKEDRENQVRRSILFWGLMPSGSIPGWPMDCIDDLRIKLGHFDLVRSTREFRSSCAELVVIPAGGYQMTWPTQAELLAGGLTKRVHHILYQGEDVRAFVHPDWKRHGGRTLHSAMAPVVPTHSHDPVDPVLLEGIDYQWAVLRSRSRGDGAEAGPDEQTISGRWVMFDNSEVTCLPDEGSVLEVSELVDSADTGRESQDVERKKVSQIAEGDILVLRVAGSGDYHDAVADALMEKNGRGDLRSAATRWKKGLAEAITKSSADDIYRALVSKGFRLDSGPGYLGWYTTNVVIAPGSVERFRTLIEVLHDAGTVEASDLQKYVDETWKLIEEVRSYGRAAGNAIKRQLLTTLKKQLRSGRIVLNDPVTLEGVNAGALALRRVAAIDSVPVHVSPRILYKIQKSPERAV